MKLQNLEKENFIIQSYLNFKFNYFGGQKHDIKKLQWGSGLSKPVGQLPRLPPPDDALVEIM